MEDKKKIRRKKVRLWRIVTVILCLLTLPVLPWKNKPATASTTVTENFGNLTYADLTNTTAEWNTRTGEIAFPKTFKPSLTGSYDTSGTAYETIVDGNYAYLADGTNGLEIIDISNPASPTHTGNYNVTNLNMIGLAKSGNYIFGADQNENGAGNIDVEIIDVSTPSAPTRAASLAIDGNIADAVDTLISGTTLYVLLDVHPSSGDTDRVYAYDITSPTSPTQLDSIIISGSGNLATEGMFVSGNRLYVGQYTAGLNIINISDNANLTSAGEYDLGATGVHDVVIKGNYAILGTTGTNTTDDITVLDISNEASISVAATLDLKYTVPAGLELSGNTLYVGTTTGGVMTVDVTDPSAPTILQNHYEGVSKVADMTIVSGKVYAAADANGLVILDYSSTTPTQTWSYNTSSASVAARDMAISGNYLYVADAGIFIFDITDPTSPVFKGSNTTGCSEAWSIALSGNYAYVGCSTSNVKIYDISTPTSPTVAATISLTGNARGVHLEGSTLYIGASAAGLFIYDVSTPTSPTLVGSVDTPGTAGGVDVSGTTAYVADLASGVTLINITNPASPSIITTYNPGGTGDMRLQIEGTTLYTASQNTFFILDVSNTSSISTTSSITGLNSGIRGFSLNGKTLYLSDSFSGIDRYDISTLTSPSYQGSMDFQDTSSTGGIYDVILKGDQMFTCGIGDPAIFSSSTTAASAAQAQSKTLDTISENIRHATLTATATTPTNTSLAYQMSPDGGTTWENVTSGTEHNFSASGSDLRYRATLSYWAPFTATPTIQNISVVYDTYRVPTQPTLTVSDNTTQPTFTGSAYSGDLTHASTDWEIYRSSSISSTTLVTYAYDQTSALASTDVGDGNFTFTGTLADRTTLLPSTNYWARVRYTNSQGDSDWSSATSFTTTNQTPTIGTVLTQTWDEDEQKTFDLDNYFTDPDGTTLTFSIGNNNQPDNVNASINSTTHVVTLTPDDDWFGTDSFIVSMSDGVNSVNSDTIALSVTNINDAPAAPTDFDITNNATVTTKTPTLTWDDASDIDNNAAELSYTLRLGTSSENLENDAFWQRSTDAGKTSVRITDALQENTTYYYLVKTEDEEGSESDWSDTQTFYVNTEALPEITVTKTAEIITAFLPVHPWKENLVGNFMTKVRAAQTNEEPPLWFEIAENPLTTYLFIIFIVASFLAAPFVIRDLKKAFFVIFLAPQNSFPKVVHRDERGTWKHPYSTYAKRARLSRSMFFTTAILLITKILFTTLVAAILFENNSEPSYALVSGQTVAPGQTLRYTIHYKNTGDGTATNLHILDTLDQNLTLVPNSITFGENSGQQPGTNEDITQTGRSLDFAIAAVPQKNSVGSEGDIIFDTQVATQIAGETTYVENNVQFAYDQNTAAERGGGVQNDLPSSYISGQIFKDYNANGRQDIGEKNLANAITKLYNSAGTVLQTATSETNGQYAFYHLTQDTYTIRLNTNSIPFNIQSIQNDDRISINVTSDNDFSYTNANFGVTPTSSTSPEEAVESSAGENAPADETNTATSNENTNNTTNEKNTSDQTAAEILQNIAGIPQAVFTSIGDVVSKPITNIANSIGKIADASGFDLRIPIIFFIILLIILLIKKLYARRHQKK